MAMASDTLSISKDLRAAGFDEQQADALATHLAATPSNLVTKEDLTLEVSRLDHKIDRVESRLRSEMHQLESRLLLRLGGGLAVATGLVLAGVGTATAVIINQLG